jgi:uncharacterized repeat protein (TIGR03803 family)
MNMHARVSFRQEARSNRSRVLSFCFLLAGCLVTAPAVAANHHQTFKHLGGAGEAGFTPVGRLLEGSDGALYGTTAYSFAPADVGGVAFRVNKNGSGYQVLHRFGEAGDGWGLFGGVVEASGGVLFGATYSGGSNGVGTVFRMNRDGSGYTILLHFGASAGDGRNPGELMMASDGVLYGTTRYGGAFTNAAGDGLGTVFKLNQDGSGYSVIHHFGGVANDGAIPVSTLVEGSDGRLFGTTEFGGSNLLGTVFRLNTDGSDYAVLRNLGADAADGSRPKAALIEASDGKLYGATVYTGAGPFRPLGTVFRLNKDGSGYAVLVRFTLAGGQPAGLYGAVVEGPDGCLYGTTFGGGNHLAGTVFKLSRDGADYSVVHHFAGSPDDGNGPRALTRGTDGVFYGVTERGGANLDPLTAIGAGTLFQLCPPSLPTSGLAFQQLSTRPVISLVEGADGRRYGSLLGETNDLVFALGSAGELNPLSVFPRFDTNGFGPGSLVFGADGNFYGTIAQRGSSPDACGGIFRLTPAGERTTVFSFAGTNGCFPSTLVAGADGHLYGLARRWPAFPDGDVLIFRLTVAGQFTVLHTLAPCVGTMWQNWLGLAFHKGTAALYGFNDCSLFRVATNGAFETLATFVTGVSGPPTSLVAGPDGNLYGTTLGYGPTNFGCVFKLTPTGTLSTLVEFRGNNGAIPAVLIAGLDGSLYGVAIGGGPDWPSPGGGTVFRVTLDGSLTTLVAPFGYHRGFYVDAMLQGGDGNLYLALEHDETLGPFGLYRLAPRPVITEIVRRQGLDVVRWNSFPGGAYQLEHQPALAATNWTTLPHLISSGKTATATNESASAAQGYYRVRLLP